MKAKFSKILVLSIVLVLSVFALTGCNFDTRDIDVDIANDATVYERVAVTAMPSIANIEVHQEIEGEWYLVNYITGLVVDDNNLLVNKQSVPKYYPISGFSSNIKLFATVKSAEGKSYKYQCEKPVELYPKIDKASDIGLVLLQLEDYIPNPDIPNDTRKLVPCVFGDSDELVFGSNTLAISTFMGECRLFEVLVSNTQLDFSKDSEEDGMDIFGDGIVPASMYTSGNHLIDDSDAYSGHIENNKFLQYTSTSSVMFNSKGEVVGFNYLMKVNQTEPNTDLSFSIGFAIKSNSIVAGLKVGGIL